MYKPQLIPALEAFSRAPWCGITSIEEAGYYATEPHEALAILVEGDWNSVLVGQLTPSALFKGLKVSDGKYIVAILIAGSLSAPHVVLRSLEIDYSPALFVGENLNARALAISGGMVRVFGDLTAREIIYGFYNHGDLEVGGITRTPIVLAQCYRMEFRGGLECPCVLSAHGGQLNVSVHYKDEQLALVMHPDLLDAHNHPKIEEIYAFLKKKRKFLRTTKDIGKPAPKKLKKKAKIRLQEHLMAAETGSLRNLDFSDCELTFVPEGLRTFREIVTRLDLSRNPLGKLPDWISEFTHLECIDLSNCALEELPTWVGELPKLKHLDLTENNLRFLHTGHGRFQALETLFLGCYFTRCDDKHLHFVTNMPLRDFPNLRDYASRLNICNHVTCGDGVALLSKTLEHLDIEYRISEGFPLAIKYNRNLKSLKICIDTAAITTAITALKEMTQLELLEFTWHTPDREQILDLAAALPKTYLRFSGQNFEYKVPDLKSIHPQEVLALVDGASLLTSMEFQRPFVRKEDYEYVLHSKLDALRALASQEMEAAVRRPLIQNAAAWADEVLSRFPLSPDTFWVTGMGGIWVECMIIQAWWLIRQEAGDHNWNVRAAREKLDILEAQMANRPLHGSASDLERWTSDIAALRGLT